MQRPRQEAKLRILEESRTTYRTFVVADYQREIVKMYIIGLGMRYHLTNAKWKYNVNMRRATFHFILYVGHCAKRTWPQFNIIIVYCNKLYIVINEANETH